MKNLSLKHSRLNNAIENWGGTYSTTFNPIKVTQNHFARMLSDKPRQELVFPVFKEFTTLPLQFYLYLKS